MYELTCPSCSHRVESLFVRIGAVVDCEACSHRFRISESNSSRITPEPAANPESGQGFVTTDEMPRTTPSGQVIGLSGLSEMMRRDPAAPTPQRTPAQSSAPSHEPSEPPEAKNPRQSQRDRLARIRQRAKKQRVQTIAIMGGLLSLVILIVIVSFLLVITGDDDGKSAIADGAGGAGNGERDGSIANPGNNTPTNPVDPPPSTPLIQAELWNMGPWEPMGRPYEVDASLSPDAWVTDIARYFDPATQQRFTVATIETDRPALVLRAELMLSIVDPNGKELARSFLPLGPITAERKQQINVPVPEVWRDQGLMVPGPIRVVEHCEGGRFLQAGIVENITEGSICRSQVEIINDADEPFAEAIVVLTAVDGELRPIHRFSATWKQALDVGSRTAFWVNMPLDDQRPVKDWLVDAIGLPHSEADDDTGDTPIDTQSASDSADAPLPDASSTAAAEASPE